jgi:ribosomal protein S18 acetylase RimI-like enzyme
MFEVSCDLKELREYWNRSGYDGNLDYLMNVVIKDSTQLIVWKENTEIVGHSVWHESTTEEHRKGDPRDKEDREALKKLLGKKKDFVELHEIWLIEKHRGKGYGNEFFDFFEAYMKSRGYVDLVFYAHHPAALAICRKHGYREGGYVPELKEHVFYHPLAQNP